MTSAHADVIPAKARIHATQTDASRHRHHRRRRCLWRQAMRSWIALFRSLGCFGLLAAGETRDGILEAYPYLEAGDDR